MAIPSYTTRKVADAALAALKADAELVAFFSTIAAVRHEEIYLNEAHKPPSLLVAVSSVTHTANPSERWDLVTTLDLAVSELVPETTTADFSHLDVIDRIRVTMWGANSGQLLDGDGNVLTQGVTTFERLPKPIWLPDVNQVRTILRVSYGSYVGKEMELIDC